MTGHARIGVSLPLHAYERRIVLSGIKRQLLRVATLPGARAPFRLLLRDRAVVFMLHRFQDPDSGITGYDPELLRRSLEYLRRERRELMSLSGLFERFMNGERPPNGAVVFTIDDGYLDQAKVAAPVFAEFDCPVTIFVTTGFLDGDLWFWWDKIEHLFSQTERREFKIVLGGSELSYDLSGDRSRKSAQRDFTARCKDVSDDEKQRAIAQLASVCEVDLPGKPPLRYAPMSWDMARACERGGTRFGPHTVTHPILSRTTDDQSTYELTESWRRVRAEVEHPVPVFCYPNGRLEDFGRREIETLGALGLLGAVIGVPGYAHIETLRRRPEKRWVINRFVCPHEFPIFVQYASGLERAKDLVRGVRPG